jgi:hypothetical protein
LKGGGERGEEEEDMEKMMKKGKEKYEN